MEFMSCPHCDEPDVLASRPTASGVPVPFGTPATPTVPSLEGTLIRTEKPVFPKFLFVCSDLPQQDGLPVRKTELYCRMLNLPKELQALVVKALREA